MCVSLTFFLPIEITHTWRTEDVEGVDWLGVGGVATGFL